VFVDILPEGLRLRRARLAARPDGGPLGALIGGPDATTFVSPPLRVPIKKRIT